MNRRLDPNALGEAILAARAAHPRSKLSKVLDLNWARFLREVPRLQDPTPHERYGDPRTIPSTLPN